MKDDYIFVGWYKMLTSYDPVTEIVKGTDAMLHYMQNSYQLL